MIASLCAAELPGAAEFQNVRQRLLEQWFDRHDGAAGERFVDLVVEELELARPFFPA